MRRWCLGSFEVSDLIADSGSFGLVARYPSEYHRMTIFDFWFDLPVLPRIGLSFVLIGVSVLTFLLGNTWFTPGGIVFALLLFAGAGSNKDGYNF
jgi:hypothetical protein